MMQLPIVAQSCTLSVSLGIVARSDDSLCRTTNIQQPTSNSQGCSARSIGCWAFDVGCWMFWLRLRRAALYRRVELCQALGNADARDRSRSLPTASRRYGRL